MDMLPRRKFLELTALSAAVTACAVNPVTGERQLMLMSPSQEIRLDQTQAPLQFSADYGVIQQDGVNDYLNTVGMKMASRSDRPDMPYSFRAVNASYLNAYAFPGGSIAMTRGLLVQLDNEAELAAVLGHEVGHVSARHTAQRMTQQTLSGLFLAGVSQVVAEHNPDYGELARTLGGIASGALLAKYSRDDERQADQLGMKYMVTAGYNPEGMVGVMDVLRRQANSQPSVIEQMFASHPMSEERFRTAKQRAAQEYPGKTDLPLYRERFMDQTAPVRKLKPTIEKLQLANQALASENPGRARELAQEAVRMSPQDYAARVILGSALLTKQQFAAARSQFNEATDIYPKEARAHQLAGVTDLQRKDYDAAVAQFQTCRKLLPQDPNGLFLLGYSHEGAGNRQQAAQNYYSYLQQVNQGQQAQYAQKKLVEWGVLKSAQ